MTTSEILDSAKRIKNTSATMSHEQKNSALINMAAAIEEDSELILRANSADLNSLQCIMSDVMLKKSTVSLNELHLMAERMRATAKLPDPVGTVLSEIIHPDGLNVKKVSTALGVVAILYENYPLITADAATLCIKSGNVCILRTNRELFGTARAIVSAMRKGLKKAGVSQSVLNLVEDTSDTSLNELSSAVGYVDTLLVRGGKEFVQYCAENAKVPCIKMCEGIRHIYVDEYADIGKALAVLEDIFDGNCLNFTDVCIVNRAISDEFLPKLYERFVLSRPSNKIGLKLDEAAYERLCGKDYCISSVENDYFATSPSGVLLVKTVESVKDAVAHISAHSSGYGECIITENADNEKIFVRSIDSSAVYVNASPMLTDGETFGLGFDIGVSTQKQPVRGPVGLKELTGYKYVVSGKESINKLK